MSPKLPLVLLLINILTACTEANRPAFSELAELPLSSPIGPARRVVQSITAEWGKHHQSFIAVLELDRRHIALVGSSAEGLTLFSLNYDGRQVQSTQNIPLPPQIKPHQILADLQTVYWPRTLLEAKLPALWQLVDSKDKRSLSYQGEQIVEIRYVNRENPWLHPVKFNHYLYNYQLTINTLSYEAVPE